MLLTLKNVLDIKGTFLFLAISVDIDGPTSK